MKNRLFIILASCILTVVVSICIFKYYHPTHFAYNDRFIIGNTQEKIIEKYGEFYSTQKNSDGKITCGTYMVRDNTPELIMSYDNSLWYEIYFEDGKAVRVNLREGYIGGQLGEQDPTASSFLLREFIKMPKVTLAKEDYRRAENGVVHELFDVFF